MQSKDVQPINGTSADSISHSQLHQNAFADFVRSAVYSAAEEPLCGLAQIADVAASSHIQDSIKNGFKKVGVAKPDQASFGTFDWHMQQLGGAIGTLLPYLALHRVVNAGAAKVLGESASTLPADLKLMSGTKMIGVAGREALLSGVTGFAYDSLLRPVDQSDSNIASERLKNGLSGAATFGVLAGTSVMLEGAAAQIERSGAASVLNNKFVLGALRNPMSAGALSAIPAGLVSSEIEARRNDQSLTFSDRLKSVYAMGFVGTALGGANLLAAQREGTARTNLDHVIDRMSRADNASPDQVSFKVVGEKSENALDSFKQRMSAGNVDASAQIDVRQYLGKGLFGGGLFTGEGVLGRLGLWGDKYGETRSLLVKHDLVQRPGATVGNAALVATCNPEALDAAVAARHIFPHGAGSVWLNRGDEANQIVFNLGERPLAPGGDVDETGAIRLGRFGQERVARREKSGNEIIPFEHALELLHPAQAEQQVFTSFDQYGHSLYRAEQARRADADTRLSAIKERISDLYTQGKQHEQYLSTFGENLAAHLEILNARGGGRASVQSIDNIINTESRIANLQRMDEEIGILRLRQSQLSQELRATRQPADSRGQGDTRSVPGKPLSSQESMMKQNERLAKQLELSRLQSQIAMRKDALGTPDSPRRNLRDGNAQLQQDVATAVFRFNDADYMNTVLQLKRGLTEQQAKLNDVKTNFSQAMRDFESRYDVVTGNKGAATPERKLLDAIFGRTEETPPAVTEAIGKLESVLPALAGQRATTLSTPELQAKAADAIYRNAKIVLFENGRIAPTDSTSSTRGWPAIFDAATFENNAFELDGHKIDGYAILVPDVDQGGKLLYWQPNKQPKPRLQLETAITGGKVPKDVQPGISMGHIYRKYGPVL